MSSSDTVLVPARADALRVGRAILEAHGQWETENNQRGGQDLWGEQHVILLGQAAMLAASPQQSPISGEGAEPVAWRYRWNGWPEGMWDVAFSDAKEQWRGVAGLTAEPLYTAPPVSSVLVGEG